jgi:hypothetical protein
MSETYQVLADGKPTIRKAADSVLDYTFDWTAWLAETGDSIASKTVTPDAGIIVVQDTVVTGNKVVVFLSGGTIGTTYRIKCKITTASSPARVDERSIYIKVAER